MAEPANRRRTVMIRVWMTPAEVARLDAIAAATERDRSKAVRWLVQQARVGVLNDSDAQVSETEVSQ